MGVLTKIKKNNNPYPKLGLFGIIHVAIHAKYIYTIFFLSIIIIA